MRNDHLGTTTDPGVTAKYPREQSLLIKRRASERDLEQAQRLIGTIVPLRPQSPAQRPPAYRCTGVRLDSLHRLIIDVVRADLFGERRHED